MASQPEPPLSGSTVMPRPAPVAPLPAPERLPSARPLGEEAPVDPNQPGPSHPSGHQLSFWQLPWVQTVLPFVTSVTVHVTILILGAVFFLGAKYVATKVVHQEEVIIPNNSMINDGPPGGVPFQGLGNDPNREARQDKFKDGGTPEGWSEKRGSSLKLEAAGGGEGDSNDSIIGVGPGGGFGRGNKGRGSGVGDALGAGEGDGNGPLAMFGTPGGGGIGPHGPVFGHGGNARKIAFVCDASGSMLNKFSTLRRELSKTVQGLRPIQSFDIIFFQEQSCSALAQALLMATPDNKLKADNWLGTVTPRGSTDPLPGIDIAFRQRPELVYLLTDGDFPDNDKVLARIRQLNKDHRIKINTIAFVGDNDNETAFMELLKKIAQENGGVYKYVRESDL